jgi:hypothetical protein
MFLIVLYSSNVIRMMKSRGMRWAGYVARMGEKRNAYRILVGTFLLTKEGNKMKLKFVSENDTRNDHTPIDGINPRITTHHRGTELSSGKVWRIHRNLL